MNIKKTGSILALAAALGVGANTASADCGDLTIADMNWASGTLIANVDKIILEAGYGCEVELVPGATETTFASMNDKGEPDIAGELWANAFIDALDTATEEGRLITAHPAPITGLGEGWWITPATAARHPELKTVLDVLDNPQLFPHPEDESKGAFVTCPAGWGCQLANANLFRAFDMEAKGWKLVDPGSAAGLDASMTKAVDRDENWFGYYWTPTSLIGKHKMVPLEWGVDFAGAENWDGCIALAEEECADPQPSAWTRSEVRTVVTANFKETGGDEALDFLSKRVFPGEVMNAMLVYMDENQAEGDSAAVEFLNSYGDVWESWVSADVAAKVKAAIN